MKWILFVGLFFLGAGFDSFAQATNNCPDFKKAKSIREGKKPKEGNAGEVKIQRGTTLIKYDVIKLGDRKLEIPAFKQFKNNMTDFTADGEEEFKRIVEKLRVHLGPNTTGEGVNLEIVGSASQIPTSFDPSKPNNNIHPDGTSIPGKTTIENNKLLALARATELGKKIKAVFPEIVLSIPSLSEIQLGATPWNDNAQKRLNAAVEKKDAKAIDAVYAPYQKEQYVMVRTRDYKTEFIQPEAVHSYYINVSPPLAWMDEGGKYSTSHFVVSEGIYNKLAINRTFNSVEARDQYLKDELKISIYHKTYAKAEHWFMLTGKESLSFRQKEDYKKIKGLYRDKVFDLKDRQILEDIIIAETLQGIQ
jgi:hypothetical protein